MKNKGKRLFVNILMVVCAIVFIGSSTVFCLTLRKSRAEDDAFEELAKIVDVPETPEAGVDSGQAPAETGEARQVEKIDYREKCIVLAEMNPDCVGWMRVPGTKIDYPVMHTPEDSQYYIRRDFYEKSSVSGTPFIGDHCDVNSQSMIVYGHNMKNGTMFGTLEDYEKKAYWEKHPVIEFHTAEEDREYEVFAAFRTRIFREEESGFRYYEYVGELSQERFDEMMRQVRSVEAYNTGIVPEYGDQLLLLSTCSYHAQEGRFVVVARRKAEE